MRIHPGNCTRRLFLALLLLVPAFAQETWTNVGRIVAVGDIHGDYAAVAALLRSAGILDARGRWAAGKTHLVQIGDMIDRGPDTRRVLDLLMTLEKQARGAGGMVHALIGNHDAMNLYGDLRYVSAADFASFRDGNSGQVRDLCFQQQVKALRERGQPEPDDAYKRDWMAAHPLGFFERLARFAPEGVYGKWIASHNTAVRINDIVFVHAGISPKYAAWTMPQLNDRVREELRDREKLKGGIVTDSDGPLWYRGLAQDPEDPLREHLAGVLKQLGARYMVVGHTPTRGGMVTPRFSGSFLMIDVGLSQGYGGNRACLVVEGGKPYALHRGSMVALPRGGVEDLLRYRDEIARIDRAAR